MHDLDFRVHRSGRAIYTSPERRQKTPPRLPSPSEDYDGRFEVPDVYMPPVTPPPRFKTPASGRRLSSTRTIYIPSADDDSDDDVKMEDMEVDLENLPQVEFPHRSPRLQRDLPVFPSEFPSRGRSLTRGMWPSADSHLQPSSSGNSEDLDEYQKLEKMSRGGYFLRNRRSQGNIQDAFVPKPVSQRHVQLKLRDERRRRRISSPTRPALKRHKTKEDKPIEDKPIEEVIRDVKRQLTCPLRELSPLSDCGRDVAWTETAWVLRFSSRFEQDWVDRALTPSDCGRRC